MPQAVKIIAMHQADDQWHEAMALDCSPSRHAHTNNIQSRRRSDAHDCPFAKTRELIQHLARHKVPQLQLALLTANHHLVQVRVWVGHAGGGEPLRQLDGQLQVRTALVILAESADMLHDV